MGLAFVVSGSGFGGFRVFLTRLHIHKLMNEYPAFSRYSQ